jgi:hypothetical protein
MVRGAGWPSPGAYYYPWGLLSVLCFFGRIGRTRRGGQRGWGGREERDRHRVNQKRVRSWHISTTGRVQAERRIVIEQQKKIKGVAEADISTEEEGRTVNAMLRSGQRMEQQAEDGTVGRGWNIRQTMEE